MKTKEPIVFKKAKNIKVSIKGPYRTKTQTVAVTKIQEELKKREEFVDLNKEVIPFITKDHAYILKNYMCNYSNETQKQIAEKNGLSGAWNTKRKIEVIFKEIDDIIKNKKNLNKFIEYCGGKKQIEDLLTFFDDEEREIFEKILLSPHPRAQMVFLKNKKLGPDYANYIDKAKGRVLQRIKKILENKKRSEDFIKENGGEDFLINEFGMTLSDENFEVLTMFMMDYHYPNILQASLQYKHAENYLTIQKGIIMKHLKDYNNRKNEVQKIINLAGGEENLFNQIYSKLNDVDKIIFEQTVLAYYKTPHKELAQMLGLDINIVSNKVNYIRKKLDGLIRRVNLQKEN